MLKLYYLNDAVEPAEYEQVSAGTFLRPLNLLAGSLRGQDARLTEKVYIRNDEDDILHDSIEVQCINIPASWRAKLIAQDTEPTVAAFLALPNANIMTHADVSDKSYYPVWLELIVPQGTAPAVFPDMKFQISSTRRVA